MSERIDTTKQPIAYYECQVCMEAGNEANCQMAGEIRLAPNGQWCCEYCYDDMDGDPEVMPVWADLPQALDLAAEVERLERELEKWRPLHPNPADARYWEGRFRDAEAELAAEKALADMLAKSIGAMKYAQGPSHMLMAQSDQRGALKAWLEVRGIVA